MIAAARAPHAGASPLLFRFYDPRVLRAYLPTCQRFELDEVFGTIDAFLIADQTPDRLLEMSRDPAGGLRVIAHAVVCR